MRCLKKIVLVIQKNMQKRKLYIDEYCPKWKLIPDGKYAIPFCLLNMSGT